MCPPSSTSQPNSKPTAVSTAKPAAAVMSTAAATTATGEPNLATCTPQALYEWLLANRFQNDASAARQFLQSVTAVVVETTTTSSAAATALAAGSSSSPSSSPSPSLAVAPVEISFSTPRSKFQVDFLATGITCTDKKGLQFHIPLHAIEHCLLFPKPEDCQVVQRKKVQASDQVLLVFKEGAVVQYKNKTIPQVCFAVPTDMPVWKPKPNDDDNDSDDEAPDASGLDRTDQFTQWLSVCCKVNVASVIRVSNPASPQAAHFWRYQFASHHEKGTSTTTGNLPFVQCYSGVNDGVLFPLQEGLLFYKPPKFVPRSVLTSIACGRSGNSQSRYVDMVLQLDDAKAMEFTNIHRGELEVLRAYIHKVLIPAMEKDALADGDAASVQDGEATSDSSTGVAKVQAEEEASAAEDDEARVAKGRPGKRKASVEARAVNRRMRLDDSDDEDEDGDFMDAENSGVESNSDEDSEEDEEGGDGGDGEDNDDASVEEEAEEEESDVATESEGEDE